jgi:uridine kinase
MLTFDDVIALVASKPKPMLVAIDGLPLSGKTTLALRLVKEFGAECMGLDDFVKPEAEWPSRDTPSFPFDWIRYSELVTAVRSLAHDRGCFFHPYDWDTGHIAREPKVIRGDGIALVEGVSVLHPDLAPLYDLRIWVESDHQTTLAASLERGVGSWAHEWQFMFLPSVELYLRTDPKSRADVVALGRGAALRGSTLSHRQRSTAEFSVCAPAVTGVWSPGRSAAIQSCGEKGRFQCRFRVAAGS